MLMKHRSQHSLLSQGHEDALDVESNTLKYSRTAKWSLGRGRSPVQSKYGLWAKSLTQTRSMANFNGSKLATSDVNGKDSSSTALTTTGRSFYVDFLLRVLGVQSSLQALSRQGKCVDNKLDIFETKPGGVYYHVCPFCITSTLLTSSSLLSKSSTSCMMHCSSPIGCEEGTEKQKD
jgi:hypothetical protein